MTPAFNSDTVQAKLSSMRELLDDVESLGPIDARALGDDRILRHATERILSLLVELATEINAHAATALRHAPAGA